MAFGKLLYVLLYNFRGHFIVLLFTAIAIVCTSHPTLSPPSPILYIYYVNSVKFFCRGFFRPIIIQLWPNLLLASFHLPDVGGQCIGLSDHRHSTLYRIKATFTQHRHRTQTPYRRATCSGRCRRRSCPVWHPRQRARRS